MRFFKSKLPRTTLTIILGIVILVTLLPQHQASADFFEKAGCVVGTAVNPIAGLLCLSTIFFGGVLYTVATIFDFFVQTFDNFFPDIISYMWLIIKNFVNLFFILILLVIAFATIFDIKKYAWQSLLTRLIVVALLVNFSLLICQTVLSVANFLTHVFISQIQGNISELILNGLGLSGALVNGGSIFSNLVDFAKSTIETALGLNIASNLTYVLFLIIATFDFVLMTAMVFIRVPIIWGLIILSPLAFLAAILPGTKSSWENWKKHFISWAFFLPAYSIVLMFTVGLINAKDQLTNSLTIKNSSVSGFIFDMFKLPELFLYFVVLLMLVYGLKAAKSMGNFTATGVNTLMGKVDSGIKRIPIPGTKGQSYASLKKGAQGTWATVKEQGLPGKMGKFYGGEKSFRTATSAAQDRMQRALGYKPSYAAQKEFLTNSNKEYDSIMQDYRFGKYGRGAAAVTALRTETGKHKADSAEGFAYRKVMGELGQTDDATLAEVIRSNRNNPNAVVDFIKNSSEKGKLSAATEYELINMATASGAYTDMATDFPARVELFKHIQGNAKIASMLTEPQFEEGLELFGGPKTADGANYLKEMAKVRPDYVANYNDTHYIPPTTPPGVPVPPRPSRESLMAKSLTNVQDIAKMPINLWGKITGYTGAGAPIFDPAFPGDIDFQRTLYDKLRVLGLPRSRLSFRSNLERYIQEAGLSITDKQALITHLSTTPTRP